MLHVKYTARDGGQVLKDAVNKQLTTALNAIIPDDGQTGLMRLFSVKHEFSNEWYRFLNDRTAALNLTVTGERFPFLFRGRKIILAAQADVYVFQKSNAGLTHVSSKAGVTPDAPKGEWKISLTDSSLASGEIENIAVICHYSVK